MRLKCTKSKNSEHYSIIQDLNVNGKRTTKVYENIGNYDSFCKRAGDQEPEVWANEYITVLNNKHKESSLPTLIKKYENKIIDKNKKVLSNVGYFFLQSLYYNLGLHNICKEISEKYQYKFDLNNILSQLIYLRILAPSSKKKANEQSDSLLHAKPFELQQTYRSLELSLRSLILYKPNSIKTA